MGVHRCTPLIVELTFFATWERTAEDVNSMLSVGIEDVQAELIGVCGGAALGFIIGWESNDTLRGSTEAVRAPD